MALTWDVKKIENHEEVTTWHAPSGDKWHPLTETLVWLCMFTSIGWEITEENIDEFIGRIKVYETLFGPMMSTLNEETGKHEPKPLTEEQIRSHLGLQTNVSYEPREVWLSRIVLRDYFAGVERKCEGCGDTSSNVRLHEADRYSDLGEGYRLTCGNCRF